MADRIGKPISQRQLRVGEMIKQSLSMIFIKNEAKVPNLETNMITLSLINLTSEVVVISPSIILHPATFPAPETLNISKI